ncbi:MAG: NAD(P)-binding domain-containing protein [Oligoflexales bacterium]
MQLYYFLLENLQIIGFLFFVFVAWFMSSRRERQNKEGLAAWKKAVEEKRSEPQSLHPVIDPALCAGCGACLRACPEGQILKLVGDRARLVSPTACVGHGECEAACPFGAITLVFGTKTRGMELPRVNKNYETNVQGLYIAGELGGMGLIRNATKQGRLAAYHAIENLDSSLIADVDVLIVGSGPAGLTAALACKEKKVSHLCLEQGQFGGSIANFPRQKLVMSYPLELPIVGSYKFRQNKVTKEELMELWTGLRGKLRLNVDENHRFVNLASDGDIFEVETSQKMIRARKVILAMGVRGTPRKLGLPNEDLPKVTYNLLEPEQYQNCHISIVGGGNAAVEAAQRLGDVHLKNKVRLLVRGDLLDRCNEENKAILMTYVEKRRVKVHYNTSVDSIEKETITIVSQDEKRTIENHYLFVFAGAELPFKFLKDLGIKIDVKHGEAPDAS